MLNLDKAVPHPNQPTNKLLCRKEAQFLLGVGSTTFFKWSKEGRFPVTRFSKRCTRYWLHDILAFVHENQKGGQK